MPTIQRSLQPPKYNKAYLIKYYNIIHKIKQVIKKDNYKELSELKGKLLRGMNLSQREREFIKALCGSLYNKWLKAIREQAKRVLKLIK
ncbi:hypothetical protein FocTR4_00011589 [Fusarium oxysporum f. sp. cubense]|uniref:Uncharacterized protein n=1 Tax=Fusarium oxysporum f. sp. cubense TaxID=61366 RepID=A0A5C6SEU0_FUSOC|nr:hypothetical protein FocTR4_00011589 [Fusarium oxysporum f. sp. cubense]